MLLVLGSICVKECVFEGGPIIFSVPLYNVFQPPLFLILYNFSVHNVSPLVFYHTIKFNWLT